MFINALTKSEYSPRNSAILAMASGSNPDAIVQVAGFKQWLELGRCVAKGEHGTHILMVCAKNNKDSEGQDTGTKRQVCKSRTVFFESQTVELQHELAA